VALVQEKQDGQVKRQALVYFVSKVLSLSKKNYTSVVVLGALSKIAAVLYFCQLQLRILSATLFSLVRSSLIFGEVPRLI
jgi:hypothetical protein